MEEGDVFLLQQNLKNQQDAVEMFKQIRRDDIDFYLLWTECCAKNPWALIYPLPSGSTWSSILHYVLVMRSSEHFRFACQWLQSLNVSIGTHKYISDSGACSLVFVALLHTYVKSNDKTKVALEFGATLPDEERSIMDEDDMNRFKQIKQVVDEKRSRVTRATLVILSMHRFANRSRGTLTSCFKLVGRDMTRLIAQEVFHSGLYLWPDLSAIQSKV